MMVQVVRGYVRVHNCRVCHVIRASCRIWPFVAAGLTTRTSAYAFNLTASQVCKVSTAVRHRSPLVAFRTPDAPTLVTRNPRKATLALTEIQGAANHGVTGSLPYDDAYLIQLRLRECPRCEYFFEGDTCRASTVEQGMIQIHDLRRDPVVDLRDPFHILHFYLPRGVERHGSDAGAFPIDDLQLQPGDCVEDCDRNLLASLRPALRESRRSEHLVRRPRRIGVLRSCGADVRRNAITSTSTTRGARAVAGTARQGIAGLRFEWRGSAESTGSGVRSIGSTFHSRLSSVRRRAAASLSSQASGGASATTADGSFANFARRCTCLRLCRSESFHAGFHRIRRGESGDVAPDALAVSWLEVEGRKVQRDSFASFHASLPHYGTPISALGRSLKCRKAAAMESALSKSPTGIATDDTQ